MTLQNYNQASPPKPKRHYSSRKRRRRKVPLMLLKARGRRKGKRITANHPREKSTWQQRRPSMKVVWQGRSQYLFSQRTWPRGVSWKITSWREWGGWCRFMRMGFRGSWQMRWGWARPFRWLEIDGVVTYQDFQIVYWHDLTYISL